MRCRFAIVGSTSKFIAIEDLGYREHKMTVTNDAEAVVKHLLAANRLKPGMRLHYKDSDSTWCGIAWEGREDHVGFYSMLGPYYVTSDGDIQRAVVNGSRVTVSGVDMSNNALSHTFSNYGEALRYAMLRSIRHTFNPKEVP